MINLSHKLLIFVIAAEAAVLIFILAQAGAVSVKSFSPDIPIAIPSPTVAPNPASLNQTIALDSPDGTKSFKLKRSGNGENSIYSFSVFTKSDSSEIFLFSKVFPSSQKLSIPLNSWSPDNKYVFLKDNSNPSNYFVFSTSDSNTEMVNVTQLFVNKNQDYTFSEITGWAAPGLLIVNTKDQKGSLRSFWFDVASKTFIPLATQFN